MSFGRSILLLVTVTSAVLAPVFVGHGLASHGGTPYAIAGGLVAFAAVMMVVLNRTGAAARDRAGSGGD